MKKKKKSTCRKCGSQAVVIVLSKDTELCQLCYEDLESDAKYLTELDNYDLY